MRCLALAQECHQAGDDLLFVMATPMPTCVARVRSEGFRVASISAHPGSDMDASETAAMADQMNSPWVVIDGYHFAARYQQIIKGAGFRLLMVDDWAHADSYCADIVLNQNIGAEERLYRCREPHSVLLLGTGYALLRREFLEWRGRRDRVIPSVARRVLVTFGGCDPANAALTVLHALERIHEAGQDLDVVVVSGGGNPHHDRLQSAVETSPLAVRLVQDARNMPELMAWADLAVSGGGSTSWELAFMGAPSALVVLAKNQQAVVTGLAGAGVAVNLGWINEVSTARLVDVLTRLMRDPAQRRLMSNLGQKLVDGGGRARVRQALHERLPAKLVGT